jgi:hypothetical protein
MAEETIEGTVVTHDPSSPFAPGPHDGLYLMTGDGRLLALVAARPFVQVPFDVAHRQGRSAFEAFIGKKVEVKGFRTGSTIWGAFVLEP